jgi:glyoxylase-like metal-dependent hydrolase (beta-lactamase superfamily II)
MVDALLRRRWEAATVLKWRIGDVVVTPIFESETDSGDSTALAALIPQATRESLKSIAWLHPHFVGPCGDFKLSFQGFVVETPSCRILVDTCVGNDKSLPTIPLWDRAKLPFLENLQKAGFSPDAVDFVLCTHLHVDHVGWNTMKVGTSWVPTFPKARYLFGRLDLELLREEIDRGDPHDDHGTLNRGVFFDSVKPVLDAGLADFVETDHRICAEVNLIHTAGHTPGHVSVRIVSEGREALITGDFVHHPCQFARPSWATSFDFDQQRSTQTRKHMFAKLAGSHVLVIGSHFSSPTAGHVVVDGEAFRLEL